MSCNVSNKVFYVFPGIDFRYRDHVRSKGHLRCLCVDRPLISDDTDPIDKLLDRLKYRVNVFQKVLKNDTEYFSDDEEEEDEEDELFE